MWNSSEVLQKKNKAFRGVEPIRASIKIKGLKSKTKYFIRIRTFSKKNGEKVYSRWSNVKNVKVK